METNKEDVLRPFAGRACDPISYIIDDNLHDVTARQVLRGQNLALARHEQVVELRVKVELDVRPPSQSLFPKLEIGAGHLVIAFALENEHWSFQSAGGGERVVGAQIRPIAPQSARRQAA
nr:hypothetical protein [Gloeobacter violaceus]